jgi:hypothetical protein
VDGSASAIDRIAIDGMIAAFAVEHAAVALNVPD